MDDVQPSDAYATTYRATAEPELDELPPGHHSVLPRRTISNEPIDLPLSTVFVLKVKPIRHAPSVVSGALRVGDGRNEPVTLT
jgi:hypothetical protein